MQIITKLKSISLSYHTLTALLAAYFALVMNLPLYHALQGIFHHMSQVELGFILSIPFFLFFALNIIFTVFTWPVLTKLFFSVIILTSCLVCYSSYQFGTIFDQDMIESVIDTNNGEALSYLNPWLVVWFIVLGIFPTLLLWWCHLKSERWLPLVSKKLASVVISTIGLFIIGCLYYQNYVSVGRNHSYLKRILVPTYYVHSVVKYINTTYLANPIPYRQIGLDAKLAPTDTQPGHKPTLFVFILGETARSQNYQMNGYPRQTNPYTPSLGVISFKHVHSCGTDTAVSVPCMFSRLNRDNYNKSVAYHQDNLTDILKRAGVDVLWRENDGADKGIPHHVTLEKIDRSATDPLCDGLSCLDMTLLNHFKEKVSQMQGNRFVVLHLIGSHGPTYYQRYPANMSYFKPICHRSDIENCSTQQIMNTYDNSLRYTDYLLAQTINKLQSLSDRYNTALIYMSDHGESLGEDGLYLHGMPYAIAPKYQTTVPLMVWMSPATAKAKHINPQCLRREADHGVFSHDNLFDSVLGFMDVRTHLYRPSQDIFEKCRSNSPSLAMAHH